MRTLMTSDVLTCCVFLSILPNLWIFSSFYSKTSKCNQTMDLEQKIQFARLMMTTLHSAGCKGCFVAMATVYQLIKRQTALTQYLNQSKHLRDKETSICTQSNCSPDMKPLIAIFNLFWKKAKDISYRKKKRTILNCL